MGILAVLSTAGFGLFYGFRLSVDIEEEQNKIAEVLRQAKANSIAIEGGYQWGVRFDNIDVNSAFFALFSGTTYAGSSTTTKYFLPVTVGYQSPSAGISTEVLFTKRTGTTTAAAIIIRLKENTALTKTINISAQGLISK